MAAGNDTKYAYAVGRIRTIEKKLLDKSKIERMVEARSSEEALKVLADADYGYSAGELSSAFQYEKLLKEELKKVYKLLKEIAPEPEVFDLFLLRNDFHNIKVLLKGEFIGADFDDLLTDTGSIPVSKLKVMIKERNMKEMHRIMRKSIEDCLDTFNRTGDPQVIDLILDKATFEIMRETAENTKNGFLTELVKILIDLTNIRTFLRVKRMKKSWDFLKKALLTGGKIDEKTFMQNLEEPLDGFMDAMKITPYSAMCEEGIGNFQSTSSLTRFEKLSDDYLTAYVRKAKYVSLGIEPLIGYLMAKENEIKIARIIMVGKINNISNEIIRERLREAYV